MSQLAFVRQEFAASQNRYVNVTSFRKHGSRPIYRAIVNEMEYTNDQETFDHARRA
jgi:hypothetical protein